MFRLLTPANQAKYQVKWQQTIDSFARRGMRALGVVRKVEGRRAAGGAAHKNAANEVVDRSEGGADEYVVVGLLPLYDPPRDDSAQVCALLRDLGVSVKMLTGDQVEIAVDTSQRLGLGLNILNCSALDPAQRVPSPTVETQRQRQRELKHTQSVLTLAAGGDGRRELTDDHRRRAEEELEGQGNFAAHTDARDEEAQLVAAEEGHAAATPAAAKAKAKAKAKELAEQKAQEKKEKKSKKNAAPFPESLMQLVERVDGFGEVMPQHKHQVVRILQHRGHIVGMTVSEQSHSSRQTHSLPARWLHGI